MALVNAFGDIALDATVKKEPRLEIGLLRSVDYVPYVRYGRNGDIDTATVPEDVWNGGGVYTGFPVGAEGAMTAVSSNAGDTGTLTITGLATEASTTYTQQSYTLNGLTPIPAGTWWRIQKAEYDTGDNVSFNLGQLSCYRTATPTDIFFVMPIGTNVTNVTNFTIPTGSAGILTRARVEVGKANTAVISGAVWVREEGKSPRLNIPFTADNNSPLVINLESGLYLPPKTDIIIRITTCSANNVDVTGDLIIYTSTL